MDGHSKSSPASRGGAQTVRVGVRAARAQSGGRLSRALSYGAQGLALEVVFTGLSSLLSRDRSLRGHSYLWMLPVYGGGGLVLEALQDGFARRGLARWQRAVGYLPAIYAIEYASGWALRRALGRCPWDYERRGLNVSGLVRLDYAPLWAAAGLVFEGVRARRPAGEPPRRARARRGRAPAIPPGRRAAGARAAGAEGGAEWVRPAQG